MLSGIQRELVRKRAGIQFQNNQTPKENSLFSVYLSSLITIAKSEYLDYPYASKHEEMLLDQELLLSLDLGPYK